MSLSTFAEVVATAPDLVAEITRSNERVAEYLATTKDDLRTQLMTASLHSEVPDDILFAFRSASAEEVAQGVFALADLIAVMEPHQRVKFVVGNVGLERQRVAMEAFAHVGDRRTASALAAELGIEVPAGRPEQHPGWGHVVSSAGSRAKGPTVKRAAKAQRDAGVTVGG